MSALDVIRSRAGTEPISAALILGSGLSELAATLGDSVTIPYAELEGFPGGGVSGHGSDLVVGQLAGRRIAILTGREHYYEHGNAAAMRPALEALNEYGATTLLLTNSAGSLDENVRPGQLMMLTDHINYAGMNPLIGESQDTRFVNLVDAYSPEMRAKAKAIADRHDLPLNEGVYLWYSGPSFETPAEIQMAIRLGANAVGMSTAPEVILGRFLGMNVWACSAITNMGAGMAVEEISHAQTKRVAALCAKHMQILIPKLVEAL